MRRAAAFLPVLGVMLLMPLAAAAANTSAMIVSCSTATACYSPNPIRITAGSTVTWTNNHSFAHTATADSGAWDTGSIPAGGSSGAITFSTPGTFAYHCQFHADMHGSIIVTAAVAVTPSASVSSAATTAPVASHAPVRHLSQSGGGPGASIVPVPMALALVLAGIVLLAARRRAPARASHPEASGEDPR